MGMKSIIVFLYAVLTGVFISSGIAFAHSGGLDSKGGHLNHKTGEYHYHRGVNAPADKAAKSTETKKAEKTKTPKSDEPKKKSDKK
jgi:hypothetical protein